ncbi:zinc transporter [Elysia marginata]|uniref:Zinc transporter n=1 Tax=Elysia marginata TaxID=1093978 RepID=A0AAV4IXA3_9GAST|nr:zinc transporter [Elysia marginata]
MSAHNNRAEPSSASRQTGQSPSKTERFDFLDFGDPTFASAGFISPRRESHLNVASTKQPLASPTAWQTQQTLVSVHTAECSDERPRVQDSFGSAATSTTNEAARCVPDSFTRSLNLGDFNVSNLPPSSDVSSSRCLPENLSPKRQISSQRIHCCIEEAKPDLVLEDYAVEFRGKGVQSPHGASMEGFTSRLRGTDVPDRIGLFATERVFRAGSPATVVPISTHQAPVRARGDKAGVISDLDATRKAGERPLAILSRSAHAGKRTTNEHYDLDLDDFFPDVENCVESEVVGGSQGEFTPLPTASSSTEEDEEDHDHDGIELVETGQSRPGNSRGRRRTSSAFRHCHKPKMASSMQDSLARRQLFAVVVLCVIFMAGEAVGGVLANSLALFTDVLHLGSDLVSFIISLLAMWLANKPATRRMSFGYHRAG